MRLADTRRHGRRGFTLVELLVVLAILVILLAMVAPTVIGQFNKAKVDATKTQIGMFDDALKKYKFDNNTYPTSAQGLQALLTQPAPDPSAALGGAAAPSMGTGMPGTGQPMGPDPMGGGMTQPMGSDPMMGGGAAPGPVPTTPGMDPNAGMGAVPGMTGGVDPMTGEATTSASTGNWAGPYIDATKLPKDSWGQDFKYSYPPTQRQDGKPEIWSIGPDGADNTGDEVRNWDPNEVGVGGSADPNNPSGMPNMDPNNPQMPPMPGTGGTGPGMPPAMPTPPAMPNQ